MHQEAGLILKCPEEGRLGGDYQFHLSIGRLNGRAMGLPARRLFASPVERFPGEAATSAGGSRIVPSPRGPIEVLLTRAGSRIARHQHNTHPVAFNNNASPCNTTDFTEH